MNARTSPLVAASCLSVVVAGLQSPPSLAEALYVPGEYATIQMGIDRAHAGDVVLVAPGAYSDFQTRNTSSGGLMTSCAFLKSGVVVRSEGGSEVTSLDLSKISGPQPVAVLALELPSQETWFEGFTIVGPQSDGVFVFLCGNVTLKDCAFRDFNAGPGTGGAAIVNGNASFIDCEFTNCVANLAGAIWHSDGHLDLIGCSFRECGNMAVWSEEIGATTSATVMNCQFLDNWSYEGGTAGVAGLRVGRALGGATVSNCMFQGNINYGLGGGGLSLGVGPKTVENCVFIENWAMVTRGGGLRGVEPTIRGCTFVNNRKAEDSFDGSAISVGNSVIENNVFYGGSGGAHIDEAGAVAWGCNVFWANPDGPGIALSPTDREVDPEFCDVDAVDLTLNEGSPCLPSDPLGCGLIGAYGQGCGTISVDSSSWAKIKGLYR